MDKNFRTVLFDLDGTLADSGAGIVNCVKYAFDGLNLPYPDEAVLKQFLGPPLKYSFVNFCKMSEEQALQAFNLYRERYVGMDCCVTENSLFEGIYELLERLYSEGIILATATTKPENIADKIITYFGIKKFFKEVCGAANDGSRGVKSEVIRDALKRCGETDLGQVLMIGDRFYDIDGAKAVGIRSAGVLWGGGTREELEKAGADYIVSTPNEIAKIILK
ncbi:MAG: HAD hydrolase-like protein [Ruminococcus sp.]|nr:HAD hydrolase-like protein [Ruminococcus sp.]